MLSHFHMLSRRPERARVRAIRGERRESGLIRMWRDQASSHSVCVVNAYRNARTLSSSHALSSVRDRGETRGKRERQRKRGTTANRIDMHMRGGIKKLAGIEMGGFRLVMRDVVVPRNL